MAEGASNDGSVGETVGPDEVEQLRASSLLRAPGTWLVPALLAAIFIALISVIYIGSVVNPAGHLHGLRVEIVDQDTGATAQGQRIDLGADVTKALLGSSAVTSRLSLHTTSLNTAEVAMDKAAAYATVVIPATFSRSALLAVTGSAKAGQVPDTAEVELLENNRLGSLGVGLAVGVLTPALSEISAAAGKQLMPLAKAPGADPLAADLLADPFSTRTTQYRPLPNHTALGLGAFYLSLIAIMCGFLGATIVNSSIDSLLGYSTMEIGPHWRQRRPVSIDRRQTLIAKWAVAIAAAPVLTGLLLLIADGALGMYAPHVLLLWLLLIFTAIMVEVGTLTLLAALGTLGQLVAMILLVYLSLASSGGSVPIQALPGFFRVVGDVEPLRQTLDGTRAIIYFGARGDAGLTHSLIVIGAELLFWAAVGLLVTTWYDRRKLYRLSPEIIGYVQRVTSERLGPKNAPE